MINYALSSNAIWECVEIGRRRPGIRETPTFWSQFTSLCLRNWQMICFTRFNESGAGFKVFMSFSWCTPVTSPQKIYTYPSRATFWLSTSYGDRQLFTTGANSTPVLPSMGIAQDPIKSAPFLSTNKYILISDGSRHAYWVTFILRLVEYYLRAAAFYLLGSTVDLEHFQYVRPPFRITISSQ